MTAHSIFNDVLGPIMCGPSSSHSAGCCRIGLMTRLLFGRDIQKANVVFDSQGSYPETYIGQGSNFGFTGGLLGWHTDNPQVKDAVAIAKEEGKQIWFSQEKLSARHPNEARIDVYNEKGEVELQVLTFSTGGGMFEIVELNGFPVFIDGTHELVYVCVSGDGNAAVETILEKASLHAEKTARSGKTLYTLSRVPAAVKEALLALRKQAGVEWCKVAPPIMPVPMRQGGQACFETAAEALAYAKEHDLDTWQAAIAYEMAVGEVSEEDIWQLAGHTYDIMKAATLPPDPETTAQFGFLPYQAQAMEEKRPHVQAVPTGILNDVAMAAIAVMENSCAHHLVVAAPTAGSSGVIPAGIVILGEKMGLPREEILKGLLSAGLAGAFIANRATFGAEVAACQAENGAASAMAAAGIVTLLGGTMAQSFQAASMALQNMLGLICDPVGGLTEIPCISRNVSSVTNSALAANMVMWGFDPVIPFDETIASMYKVGQQLPASLRCTCLGGLCVTPTGQKLACQLAAKRK